MKTKKLKSIFITVLVLITILMSSQLVQAVDSFRYADEAFKLYSLGLYQGTAVEYFQPSLGEKLNREQVLTMFVQIIGDEKEIAAMTNQEVENILKNIPDQSQISTWARKYTAYAYMKKFISKDAEGRFLPKGPITGREYCVWILTALGYESDIDDGFAAAKLVDIGGLSATQMLQLNNKELTRDDFIGITYSSLNAVYPDGATVISKLVASGKVSEEKALSMGVYVQDKLIETLSNIVDSMENLINDKLDTYEEITEAEKLLIEAKAISSKLRKNEFEVRIMLAEGNITKAKELYSTKKEFESKLERSVNTLEQLAGNKLVIEYNISAVEDALKNAKQHLEIAKKYGEYESFEKRINKVENELIEMQILEQAEKLVSSFETAVINNITQIDEVMEIGLKAEEIVKQITNVQKREQYMARIEEKKKLIEEIVDTSIPAKVESVVAPNLKQLVITFTKPIFEETIDASTLKISEEINYRKLSEDGKRLTLHFSERLPQNNMIFVTIDGIRDINGNIVPAYEAEVMTMDVVSPKVEELIFVHNKLIKLRFSEPFDFINTGVFEISRPEAIKGAEIKIDGDYFYGRFKTSEADQTLSIELLNALKDGEHVIELSGIKDWAGFRCLPYTERFLSYTDDTPPEALNMWAEDTETIKITFNETIRLLASNVRVTEFGGRYKAVSNVSIDGNNAVIRLAEPLGEASIYGFKVNIQYILDEAGNAGSIEIESKMSDDREAPKISSFLVTNYNTLKVIFNKAVDVKNALLLLYDSEGNAIEKEKAGISIRAINDSNREYEVFIQYIRGKRPTQYTLQLSGIIDKSIRKNPIIPEKIDFVSNDEYRPIIYKVSRMQDSSGLNDIIEIIFSESMDISTINSLSRYIVKGVGRSQPMSLDGIEGSEIVSISEDGKRVIIMAPRASLYGYNYITILGAVDAYGKPLFGQGSNMGSFIEMK